MPDIYLITCHMPGAIIAQFMRFASGLSALLTTKIFGWFIWEGG